jgi:hypothetical protein
MLQEIDRGEMSHVLPPYTWCISMHACGCYQQFQQVVPYSLFMGAHIELAGLEAWIEPIQIMPSVPKKGRVGPIWWARVIWIEAVWPSLQDMLKF